MTMPKILKYTYFKYDADLTILPKLFITLSANIISVWFLNSSNITTAVISSRASLKFPNSVSALALRDNAFLYDGTNAKALSQSATQFSLLFYK